MLHEFDHRSLGTVALASAGHLRDAEVATLALLVLRGDVVEHLLGTHLRKLGEERAVSSRRVLLAYCNVPLHYRADLFSARGSRLHFATHDEIVSEPLLKEAALTSLSVECTCGSHVISS